MKPIVDGTFILKKFTGKGAWTYAELPGIKPNKTNPFGWMKVYGAIDNYQLSQYKLMPMGNGNLFLPVKKIIRKSINKDEGDKVYVLLYLDDSKFEIPKSILACFKEDDPIAFDLVQDLTDSNKKAMVDWIYAAKKEETKVERILTCIENIKKGNAFNKKTNRNALD